MNEQFNAETLEVSGFMSALKALRLPFNKSEQSSIETITVVVPSIFEDTASTCLRSGSSIIFAPKDIQLLQTLVKRGDEHAKPARLILAYAKVVAPLDFWHELETYEVGHQRGFSSSTMHTEGRALSGHALRDELHKLPIDHPFTKVDCWSYQTLRRIVEQRFDHRKECWHFFIEWIRTLPLADELILVGLEDKLKVHDEYLRKYNNNEI